jgi:hypothetical protein
MEEHLENETSKPIILDDLTGSEAIQSIAVMAQHEDHSESMHVIATVKDRLPQVNPEFWSVFYKIPSKTFVVAFQSRLNGKFLVVWKLEKIFTLHVLDNIRQEQLVDLCAFVDFLAESLKQNHAGECHYAAQ